MDSLVHSLLVVLNPLLSTTVDKNRPIQEKQWEMNNSVKGEDPVLAKRVLGPGIVGIVLMY